MIYLCYSQQSYDTGWNKTNFDLKEFCGRIVLFIRISRYCQLYRILLFLDFNFFLSSFCSVEIRLVSVWDWFGVYTSLNCDCCLHCLYTFHTPSLSLYVLLYFSGSSLCLITTNSSPVWPTCRPPAPPTALSPHLPPRQLSTTLTPQENSWLPWQQLIFRRQSSMCSVPNRQATWLIININERLMPRPQTWRAGQQVWDLEEGGWHLS